MLHIIIVCGPDGSGKKKVLERVWKALSHNKNGRRISAVDNPIDMVKSKNGVAVGVAKAISESDVKCLIKNSRGLHILICSTRKDGVAWKYCNLIQQANGEYIVFLKRKEQRQYKERTEESLCNQILSCCTCFKLCTFKGENK